MTDESLSPEEFEAAMDQLEKDMLPDSKEVRCVECSKTMEVRLRKELPYPEMQDAFTADMEMAGWGVVMDDAMMPFLVCSLGCSESFKAKLGRGHLLIDGGPPDGV